MEPNRNPLAQLRAVWNRNTTRLDGLLAGTALVMLLAGWVAFKTAHPDAELRALPPRAAAEQAALDRIGRTGLPLHPDRVSSHREQTDLPEAFRHVWAVRFHYTRTLPDSTTANASYEVHILGNGHPVAARWRANSSDVAMPADYRALRAVHPSAPADTLLAAAEDRYALAGHHISRTAWGELAWHPVSVNGDRVRMRSAEPLAGESWDLVLNIQPNGALVLLEAEPTTPKDAGFRSNQYDSVRMSLYLVATLLMSGLFIRRLSNRLVDARSSKTDAGLMALVIGLAFIVVMIRSVRSEEFFGWAELMALAFGGLLLLALGGLFTYVLSGTGSSYLLAAQPEKLQLLSFIRRGYWMNQPVGTALLRSVVAGAALAGATALIVALIPGVEVHARDTVGYAIDEPGLPGLTAFTTPFFHAAFLLYTVFMSGMGWVYTKSRNPIWAYLLVATAFAISFQGVMVVEPWTHQAALGALTGLFLAFLFHAFGPFTVAATMVHAALWMFLLRYSGDPASGITTTFPVTAYLIGVSAFGIRGVASGRKRESLPEYVPEYLVERYNRERIERELEIARAVHMSFLPETTPTIPGAEVAAWCEPASQVGGDYYDFLELGEGRWGLVVGDVSGKGIQAAFYMTLMKGFVQSLAPEYPDPSDLLDRVNHLFCRNAKRGTFVSVLYGVLDTRAGTFTYARAGHNPLLWKPAAGTATAQESAGLAIGMTPDGRFRARLQTRVLPLAPGDSFVLYTDGYSEAMNARHDIFGTERLLELLDEHAGRGASALLNIVNASVETFVGQQDQHDDMTILIVRYTG